jgi:hypothetical protein
MERVYTTPLLDKLGVKPGSRVAIVGDVGDVAFRAQLADRTSDISMGKPKRDTDVVLLAADTIDELMQIGPLQRSLKPNGAIWVVSRKGNAATLRDVEVMDAAKAVGLIDNKVASFSATHTALRLVIPVARRPK